VLWPARRNNALPSFRRGETRSPPDGPLLPDRKVAGLPDDIADRLL